jgi:hypothetical protein
MQQVAERPVIVVLRQGSTTPHGPNASEAKEIVNAVADWSITAAESLELFNANKERVATFRDWSFVKFLEPKDAKA